MTMLLDIAIVLTVILTTVSGTRNGFVRSIMNLITFVCALYCAISFSELLSDWLYTRFFYEGITRNAQRAIEGIVQSGLEQLDLSLLFQHTPQAFHDLILRYNGSYEAVEEIYRQNIALPAADIIRKMAENLAVNSARLAADTTAFGGIFFAVTLVLRIITALLDLIFRLPVLNSLNRFAGFLLGLVCGCAYGWILANLLAAALPAAAAFIPGLDPAAAADSALIQFLTGSSYIAVTSVTLTP